MNASKHLKVLFALTLLTLCLPWFTYNAKVMGYCHGYAFMKWFIVPLALVGLCVFYPRRKTLLILLAEAGQLASFFDFAFAFGYWQQVCNIRAGAQWLEGFHTVQPGYWVSVCFFVLFFVSFQIELMKGKLQTSPKVV